ncbi:hypothetical protein AX14_002882 [Amanita brunnescens Koide BX004]|nr:hypothetical protein AX14_002882 [Amanita brunnescens Koide BX004]
MSFDPRYEPVATDDDDELDAAFASDDDEQRPEFTRSVQPSPAIPGAYDFERDYQYDCPPPGSPPHPSDRALPNDYGNTNGHIPTSPIRRRSQGPSFIRRAVGALLPQHYSRVPTADSHPLGGGIENDGVFANVMAKPQPQRTAVAENGDTYLVPEDTVRDNLPSYQDAHADAVPPYWETVVHAPADPSRILVDDLPAGSVFIFVLNILISYLFQFVGFFLTYLLHTTHAAKYGSRIGLSLTLIQFALYSHSAAQQENAHPRPPAHNGNPTAPVPDDQIALTSKDWLPILLLTTAWLLLLYSLIGYWRVKRWETSLRSSQTHAMIPERTLQRGDLVRIDEHGDMLMIPSQGTLAEARLTRDLQAAGLM